MVPSARALALTFALPILGAGLARSGFRLPENAPPVALPNDNRVAAGTRHGDTLELSLVAERVRWQLDGPTAPALPALAFAEEGHPPSIPGPLARVRAGTTVHVHVRNPLTDTLFVHGLAAPGRASDSLIVPPGGERDVRFIADAPGSYAYWASASSDRYRAIDERRGEDAELSGALIVDPAAGTPAADRVFVITAYVDSTRPDGSMFRDARNLRLHEFLAINGLSWPHTERLAYTVGDTVRWRVLNASGAPHPMHLHGFFFRVDARGNWSRDSVIAPEHRRLAVTELLKPGETMAVTWSPNRPGGWLFHCHITTHTEAHEPVGHAATVAKPDLRAAPDDHLRSGMGGLLLSINVAPKRGGRFASATWTAPPSGDERTLRLLVQSDSLAVDRWPRFGYVLQRGTEEPAPDSVPRDAPVLVLHRGEPTAIEIVNRTHEPTAVHWHGVELESFFDGVPGLTGSPAQRTPMIPPGGHFIARMRPPRAGTFMYHTHFDAVRQQMGGLDGALIVLEPGERWDPTHDLPILVSDAQDGRGMLINGAAQPRAIDVRVGERYRLRLMNLTVALPLISARVLRDSSVVPWRALARDGADLPPAERVLGTTPTVLSDGQTADFELIPDRTGPLDLAFDIGKLHQRLRLNVR